MTAPANGFERLELPAELASLARIQTCLSAEMARRGVEGEAASDLLLCVSEAANNAIDHGSRFNEAMPVVLEYRFERDRAVVLLTDAGGRTFDPGFFRELALRKDWGVGGRGILLMYELLDEVDYFFVPGRRTTVRLVKRLPASETPRAGV